MFWEKDCISSLEVKLQVPPNKAVKSHEATENILPQCDGVYNKPNAPPT